MILDEASWTTPTLGDYARMAITLAARRSVALAIRQTWGAASADRDVITLDDDDDASDAEEERERSLWSDA